MTDDHEPSSAEDGPRTEHLSRSVHADVEASYERLLRIVPDAIAVYDIHEERSVWTGAQVTAMLGYTAAEIQALTSDMLKQIIHPDDLPGLRTFFASFETAAEDVVREHEYRGVHKAGTTLWFRSRATPFSRDNQGHVRDVLVATRDITEQKQAHAQLARSRERLHLTLEAAHLGTWFHDAQRQETLMDEQCRTILGLPTPASDADHAVSELGYPSETVGFEAGMPIPPEHVFHPDDAFQSVHPDDFEHVKAAADRALDPAEPDDFSETHRIVNTEGEVRWVHGAGRAYFSGTGPHRQPVAAIGVVTDVTEEVGQQERLERARQRLTLATESALLGWGTLEVDTGRLRWDERGRTIIGLSAAEAPYTADDWYARIHPDDREGVQNHLQQCIETGHDFDYTYRVAHADGEVRHVRGTGTFYREAPNAPMIATGLVQDVTDQRRAESDLKALMRTLEERVRKRTAQVQELSKQLALAEQEERRRLGEVLHEDLQQRLFALQMHLDTVQQVYQQEEQVHPQIAEALGDTVHWTKEAIGVTRNLSHDLLFTTPTDALADALRVLGDQFKRRYDLEVWVAYHLDDTAPFDPSVQILVVRCIQNLLLDVTERVGLCEAYITVEPDPADDEQFSIHVADEGCDFEPDDEDAASASNLRLRDLRQRIALVDGEVHVETNPDEGTRVTLTFPRHGRAFQ